MLELRGNRDIPDLNPTRAARTFPGSRRSKRCVRRNSCGPRAQRQSGCRWRY